MINNGFAGSAYAPFAVGNSGFSFSFDFYPTALTNKGNFEGLAVALTTAPPTSMSGSDNSLVIGIHSDGVYVGPRTGLLQDGITNYGGGSPLNAIAVSNGGKGYKSVPTVSLIGYGNCGTPPNLTAVLSGGTTGYVTGVTINDGGDGCANTEYSYPSVVFTGGSPTYAAQASVYIQNSAFSWPQYSSRGSLAYWRWTGKISRDNANHLTFSIYTDGFKGGTVPYFTRTTTIPTRHQTDSFRFVSLVTIGGNSYNSSGTYPYAVGGVITNIHGSVLTPLVPVPTISSILPGAGATTFQSGKNVTITGTNFSSLLSYSLVVGPSLGTPPISAKYLSSTTLSATLPNLANGNVYGTHLRAGNLDAEYYPGLLYSAPMLSKITPFEVLPTPANAADATVQFYGQGFDSTSRVTFNGSAGIVTYIDPTHLSVVVPAGSQGVPHIAVTASNGAVMVYDSNSASPKINFGYAAHPYLQFTSATSPACTNPCAVPSLASIQAKWTNPNFADYVNAAQQSIVNPLPSGTSFFDYGYAGLWSNNSSWISTYKANMLAAPEGIGLAKGEVNNIRFTQWGAWSQFLYSSNFHLAGLYDALFASLTPSERAAYQEEFLSAISYYAYTIGTQDDTNSESAETYSNRQAIAAAGAGYSVLALANSLQQFRDYHPPASVNAPMPVIASIASTQLAQVNSILTIWANAAITPDGGMAEGILYGDYGGTAYVSYGRALQNMVALGIPGISSDSGIFATNYQNYANWINATWDGTMLDTFNDSQPGIAGVTMMLDIGTRMNQPNLIYLADYLRHKAATGSGIYKLGQTVFDPYAFNNWTTNNVGPLELVFRNSTFPSTFSGWPLAQIQGSAQQASLRSDSTMATPFYMGIKGASYYDHNNGLHGHQDTGSFVLQSRGEEFLLDPGYYLSGGGSHSLLTIDGTLPGTGGANLGIIDPSATVNTSNFRATALDLTSSYAGSSTSPSRVRRNFAMYVNGAKSLAFVLDDIATAGGGAIQATFQAGQTVTPTSNSSFVMTGQASKVSVTTNQGSASNSLTSATGLPIFLYDPSNPTGTTPQPGLVNSWIYGALANPLNFSPPFFQQLQTVTNAYRASADNPMLSLFAPSNLMGSDVLTATIDRQTAHQITVHISDGGTMVYTQPGGAGSQWNLSSTTASSGGSHISYTTCASHGLCSMIYNETEYYPTNEDNLVTSVSSTVQGFVYNPNCSATSTSTTVTSTCSNGTAPFTVGFAFDTSIDSRTVSVNITVHNVGSEALSQVTLSTLGVGYSQYNQALSNNSRSPQAFVTGPAYGPVTTSNIVTGQFAMWSSQPDSNVSISIDPYGTTSPLFSKNAISITNIAPGATRSYTVYLRISTNPTENIYTLAPEAFSSFATEFPQLSVHSDRRPILSWYIANPGGSGYPNVTANNPRAYLGYQTADFTNASVFRAAMANQVTGILSSINQLVNKPQGIVLWDIEGQEFAQPMTYIGDPRIGDLGYAPEMFSGGAYSAIDVTMASFKAAGLKVGITLRPQRVNWVQSWPASCTYNAVPDYTDYAVIVPAPFLKKVYKCAPGGTYSIGPSSDGYGEQTSYSVDDVADVVALLKSKIDYARNRWGTTLYYVDSSVWVGGAPMETDVFRQLESAYPDSLFIPEESNYGTYGTAFPYSDAEAGGKLISDPLARYAYPTGNIAIAIANCANDNNCWTPANVAILQAGQRLGDIAIYSIPSQTGTAALARIEAMLSGSGAVH